MKKMLFLLISLLPITGCSPMATLMVPDEQIAAGPTAKPAEATIIFIRPAQHGAVIDSAVFLLEDNAEEFIGKLGYEEGVSTSVKPGEHLFMVTDQNINHPRFMKAEVEAGKSYYAVVSPRGWPAIIFALVPVKSNSSFKFGHGDLPGWLESTVWVKKGPEADSWFKKNKGRIHSVRIDGYKAWLNVPESQDPQFLLSRQDAFRR